MFRSLKKPAPRYLTAHSAYFPPFCPFSLSLTLSWGHLAYWGKRGMEEGASIPLSTPDLLLSGVAPMRGSVQGSKFNAIKVCYQNQNCRKTAQTMSNAGPPFPTGGREIWRGMCNSVNHLYCRYFCGKGKRRRRGGIGLGGGIRQFRTT